MPRGVKSALACRVAVAKEVRFLRSSSSRRSSPASAILKARQPFGHDAEMPGIGD